MYKKKIVEPIGDKLREKIYVDFYCKFDLDLHFLRA